MRWVADAGYKVTLDIFQCMTVMVGAPRASGSNAGESSARCGLGKSTSSQRGWRHLVQVSVPEPASCISGRFTMSHGNAAWVDARACTWHLRLSKTHQAVGKNLQREPLNILKHQNPKSEYSNTPNPPKKTADPKPIPAETLRSKSGAELFGPSAFLIRKRQDSSPTYTGAESPRPSFMKSMAET